MAYLQAFIGHHSKRFHDLIGLDCQSFQKNYLTSGSRMIIRSMKVHLYQAQRWHFMLFGVFSCHVFLVLIPCFSYYKKKRRIPLEEAMLALECSGTMSQDVETYLRCSAFSGARIGREPSIMIDDRNWCNEGRELPKNCLGNQWYYSTIWVLSQDFWPLGFLLNSISSIGFWRLFGFSSLLLIS